jgi:hypothetical protein
LPWISLALVLTLALLFRVLRWKILKIALRLCSRHGFDRNFLLTLRDQTGIHRRIRLASPSVLGQTVFAPGLNTEN